MALKNQVVIKSFAKQIERDLKKGRREKLKKAGQHVRKKIRGKIKHKRISQPGEPPGRYSGNLYKGIRYEVREEEALVGAAPPAYHAHLLEFGTEKRTVGKTGKDAGKVEARPFIFPTFEEEKEEVKRILSEEWLD
jgi:HK97 gp10 family phage protein